MLFPVILSGGVGSRLWPVSREGRPKQFLPLGGEHSMLQSTCLRTQGLQAEAPIVVCNEAHRFMVAEQLREIDTTASALILEPEGRNTAPAIALAAHAALLQDPNAVLLVLPADHHVARPAEFVAKVASAMPIAESGSLVTFGVVPERPETGYGYIRCGDERGPGISVLAEFVEKPDAKTAQDYVESGNFLWNSGMFLFRADRYLAMLSQFQPEMARHCEAAMASAEPDRDFLRPNTEAFAACPSDSIDYAVMEHTDAGAVVALDCGWSDVGAWSAMWDIGSADSAGNVLEGDVLAEDTRNSYVRSESRLVTTTGIDDLVVVETADAVLVAGRDRVQNVKSLVTALKTSNRSEADVHAKVFRPWGSYESLIISERFQVKLIVVNPGQQLSLQKHFHRAEHWIVVSGVAEVTREDEVFDLSEDQSTYIPQGARHRLANRTDTPVELIEVQSGSYLGEDDIVRFEDDYGR